MDKDILETTPIAEPMVETYEEVVSRKRKEWNILLTITSLLLIVCITLNIFTLCKKYEVQVYNGKDGVNGIDGKDGVQGIQGIQGEKGLDGKDGINGLDGKDGINGTNGKDGVDGKDGLNGLDGRDGKDGVNGVDGIDGKDGVDGLTPYIKNGYWWIGNENTGTKTGEWTACAVFSARIGSCYYNTDTQMYCYSADIDGYTIRVNARIYSLTNELPYDKYVTIIGANPHFENGSLAVTLIEFIEN